jgi:hypothetical protein
MDWSAGCIHRPGCPTMSFECCYRVPSVSKGHSECSREGCVGQVVVLLVPRRGFYLWDMQADYGHCIPLCVGVVSIQYRYLSVCAVDDQDTY